MSATKNEESISRWIWAQHYWVIAMCEWDPIMSICIWLASSSHFDNRHYSLWNVRSCLFNNRTTTKTILLPFLLPVSQRRFLHGQESRDRYFQVLSLQTLRWQYWIGNCLHGRSSSHCCKTLVFHYAWGPKATPSVQEHCSPCEVDCTKAPNKEGCHASGCSQVSISPGFIQVVH